MSGLNALVTGASSGIGLVFAEELAKEGYSVTCVARNKDNLSKLTERLGNNSRYIQADLTNENDLAEIAREIEDTKYSILINNAGYAIFERFENCRISDSINIIQLNINALVHLSYVFLKKAVAGDALINVSSVLSLLPYPGGAVYSGAKAFVTNFTEALWYEYKDRDIYVMALLPGVTDTNFHKVALGEKTNKNPAELSYPPEVIVREALNALRKRKKPTVISGPRYRWLTAVVTKMASRKQIVNMMGKNSSGL